MKQLNLTIKCFILFFVIGQNIYSQKTVDLHSNQIYIRSDRVFMLNGEPFFPIMVSHELGPDNFNNELKKPDSNLYGFNIINLHLQVSYLFNCYYPSVMEVISGDLTSGSHYTSILGNMGWNTTYGENAKRIFDYVSNTLPGQNFYLLSDCYAFMPSTVSDFLQNWGLQPPCPDNVHLDPVSQTTRNEAIDRINSLAQPNPLFGINESKLIGFFSADDANMMGTRDPSAETCNLSGSYYSNYYFNHIDQQINDLVTTYQYARSVWPNSIVYMALPPVFYPRAMDPDNWGSVPLDIIRMYWKDAAHRLAAGADVFYGMFFNFEDRGWGWNWRIYDGPGYPMWYVNHLDTMFNQVLSGYEEPKAILGGYWMDGQGFLPYDDEFMPQKLKWATYVSLAKGATGLNFFGWHYKIWLPHYWEVTKDIVDELVNVHHLDQNVFTKTNSGPIGHSITGSQQNDITYAVYKINNWKEYYMLITNNPIGSIDGPPELNNLITVTGNQIDLCYYDVEEVFSGNTVTVNDHQFVYDMPWFGTALFHIKLKEPLPNCPDKNDLTNKKKLIDPQKFYLDQNYPNPFNPITIISYGIPKDAFVTIEVYNILGQKIVTLVEQYKKAGNYNVTFDGSNYAGGLYIFRIKAGDFTDIKKMMLIK